MSVKIGSNPGALLVQRNLAHAASQLSSSLEKLSSGLRINRGSDDAAGLAIADKLNVDTRVFSQATRNLNDAISFISIGHAAYEQLKQIVTRQRELAEQSSSGTYSSQQRRALNAEATALTDEFNRILETTRFNGMRVIQETPASVVFQGGYGEAQSLRTGIGEQASVSVGTGAFTASGAGWASLSGTADVNGDGRLDLLGSNGNLVRLAQSDGTYAAQQATGATFNATCITADLDGDGDTDLAGVNGSSLAVYYNNGQGAFSGGVAAALVGGQTPTSSWNFAAADFNGDGRTDIAATYNGNVAGTNDVEIFTNRGGGQFSLSQVFTNAGYYQACLGAKDINSDGRADLAIGNRIYLSSGNGTLQHSSTITGTTGSNPTGAYFVDLNKDGYLDYLCAGGGSVWSTTLLSYAYGNGSGGFTAAKNVTLSYNVRPWSGALSIADLNGDGYSDTLIADSYSGKTFTLLNDRKGNLSITGEVTDGSVAIVADKTGDGVPDVVTRNASYSAQTTRSQRQARLDLTSVEESRAAMTYLDRQLARINLEVASLGANESRIEKAISVLQSSREALSAARSRIVDVDIAAESAEKMKSEILLQAGAAILAQANRAPDIALTLLRSG